ncbi:hypothetical protein SmJEL517_g05521 [Synchytrium microbalum]|uniref:Bromo domain-containing protein n=1 Tax=Synchytrium microbalum TaxID=1806994 RepID=A0A507BUY6_9FUNG|nr:uncharacterized protein SmJEL517_g05521 [Synchytrium microbalum]TPX31078.1 hypothetical protein SmJEL517_g05521 [Synchytrium microbalum]
MSHMSHMTDEQIARTIADGSRSFRPRNKSSHSQQEMDSEDDEASAKVSRTGQNQRRNYSDAAGDGTDDINNNARRQQQRSSFGNNVAESPDELIQKCRQIIEKVKTIKDNTGRVISALFHEMVDPDEVEGYYDFIKQPIALVTIEQKLDGGEYTSFDEIKTDFDLMWKNAMSFNLPGSEVYTDAQNLQKFTNKEFGPLIKMGKSLKITLKPTKPERDDESSESYNGPKRPPTVEESKQLFQAAQRGDVRKLDSILRLGVDPNCYQETQQGNDRFTWPLMSVVASNGRTEAADLLIKYGANVEITDTWYEGRPLAWAAWNGHIEFCRRLIERHGANRFAKNTKGQVAFDLVSDPTNPKWRGVLTDGDYEDSNKSKKRKKQTDSDETERPPQRMKYDDDEDFSGSTSSKPGQQYATPGSASQRPSLPRNSTVQGRGGSAPLSAGPSPTIAPPPVSTSIKQQNRIAASGGKKGGSGRATRAGSEEMDDGPIPSAGRHEVDLGRVNQYYTGLPFSNIIANTYQPPKTPLIAKIRIFSNPDPSRLSVNLPRQSPPYLLHATSGRSLAVSHSISSVTIQVHCPNNYPDQMRSLRMAFKDMSANGGEVKIFGPSAQEMEPSSGMYEFKAELKEGTNVYALRVISAAVAESEARPPTMVEEINFVLQRF